MFEIIWYMIFTYMCMLWYKLSQMIVCMCWLAVIGVMFIYPGCCPIALFQPSLFCLLEQLSAAPQSKLFVLLWTHIEICVESFELFVLISLSVDCWFLFVICSRPILHVLVARAHVATRSVWESIRTSVLCHLICGRCVLCFTGHDQNPSKLH